MTILSVDDNIENLYLVEMLCLSQGHNVMSAHNGVQALERLRTTPFDLIISDILMPEMDGFQLCRTVKLDDRLKRIPFIFYTATYTSKEDQDLALSLGASRFIIKPAEPEEFLAAIEQVVHEGEAKQIQVPVPNIEEQEILGVYNRALVHKLEQKLDQLDREATARRVAEDALRRSEEKFSKAFLLNPAAIAINDLTDRRYIDINETFERLTGYSRQEVVGKHWDDLNLWLDARNRDDAFRHLLEQGQLRNWEFGFRRKDGTTGTALFSADLVELDGRPCAVTAKMDITERLQLEAQLQHAQKLESIGRLAGGVAHDFNNTLTVIAGYNALTLNALDPGSPLRVYAQEIGRAADSAASLTRQLLTFSRKQVISVKPVDLNTVIKETERMLERVIGEDIRLVTTLDPALGRVMTDPDQIHQVIMNLAVNSRDAMPKGGTLIVETANVDLHGATGIDNAESAAGPHVRISITDTGIGMSDEVLRHIFEPFYTTKERGKGTGLGLSTVYGIVRQSNGWIEVSSRVGQGTTFNIFLPRITVNLQDEPVRPVTANIASQGSGTILVVEDEGAVRTLTEALLRMSGFKVLSAANGTDALEITRTLPEEVDLLLTDVIMPGLNGKELFELLRKEHPHLKVVFTSGYTDDVIVPRGVLDPSVAYVAKPFSQETLVAKLREVLSGGAAAKPTGGNI